MPDKVGVRFECPKCRAPIVPPPEEDAGAAGRPAAECALAHPPPPAVAINAGPIWEDMTKPPETAGPTLASHRDLVPVSRRVVYLQGVLLGLVAVSAFVLGILTARSWPRAGDSGSSLQIDRPCTVHGHITSRSLDGKTTPDSGCVVLAVPTERLPDEKLDYVGLRAVDPPLPPVHRTMRRLAALGATCARADEQGGYRIELPRGGTYFVLFLSRRPCRPGRKFPNRKDLAELGRYITSAFDLLDDRQYAWRRQQLRNDVRLDWEFAPAMQ